MWWGSLPTPGHWHSSLLHSLKWRSLLLCGLFTITVIISKLTVCGKGIVFVGVASPCVGKAWRWFQLYMLDVHMSIIPTKTEKGSSANICCLVIVVISFPYIVYLCKTCWIKNLNIHFCSVCVKLWEWSVQNAPMHTHIEKKERFTLHSDKLLNGPCNNAITVHDKSWTKVTPACCSNGMDPNYRCHLHFSTFAAHWLLLHDLCIVGEDCQSATSVMLTSMVMCVTVIVGKIFWIFLVTNSPCLLS